MRHDQQDTSFIILLVGHHEYHSDVFNMRDVIMSFLKLGNSRLQLQIETIPKMQGRV